VKDIDLTVAAGVAVEQCLAVESGETVLVVCDKPCLSVGKALQRASIEAGADVVFLEMLPRSEHGEEPPSPVAEAMRSADVVFAPTSHSLTHTDARRKATASGARVATLPGITEGIFSRTLVADYDTIEKRTEALAAHMQGGENIRITTPAGTDISFSIAGRKVMADTGIVHNAGVTNLPAGEAFLAPVEGTGDGLIAVDGSIGSSGVLDAPIMIEVVDGLAGRIYGHPYCVDLERGMDAAGPDARNLAELGIGTNESARLVGEVLEDEKILGTVHLAFGDNQSMGGQVSAPFHQDGILLRPTVWLDGVEIMRDGDLLVSF
jgi:leucyl aminopeptidase (aminopeptidase T)